MTERSDELVGRTLLGRYRIVRRLARGGMGVIYLARSEGAAGFVKPVVIKRVVPDLVEDEAIVQMFVREAHILASLHHPGIVQVLDFAEEEDAYVMVLEYVRGYHLGRWHRYVRKTRGRFPTELALHIMVHVLEALHYAHTLEKPDGTPTTVVHRDVSPSNVLLDTEGNVKLADFGIARMSNLHSQYRTESPSLKGKMSYLAPELFSGEAATPLADVYAAGVVLHELLSGANAFHRKEVSETVMRVLNTPLPAIANVREDVPPGIDEVLARAAAKDPSERFPDAATFATALRHLRRAPDADSAAALAAQAREDFLGGLPHKLGAEPLEELDAAWRQESGSEPPPEPSPRRSSSPPTMPHRTPAPSSPGPAVGSPVELEDEPPRGARPRRRRRRWLIAAVAVTVGLVATGAGLVLFGDPSGTQDDDGKQFILVDRGGESGAGADETAAGPDRAAPPPSAPPSAGPTGADDAGGGRAARPAAEHADSRGETAASSGPGDDALGRAFARQQPKVEQCFAEHADDVQGSPEIAVRFRLSASGAVRSAELAPDALASTALGRCLLGVAQQTPFPGRREPISFRIPITVRRR